MTDSAQPFGDVADDARISETPLVDKGFASLRMIGNGLYATISDLSKGETRPCVTAAFWWGGMQHSWWKDSRRRQARPFKWMRCGW